MGGYIKQALKTFSQNPLVLIYCLTGAVLGACVIYLDEFWQIAFDTAGIPVVFFGAFGAASSALRIPGRLLAHRLKSRFSYKSTLSFVILVCAAGFSAIFLLKGVASVVPMLLIFIVSGITDPLVLGFLHSRTESGVRATAESFTSLGLRVISVGVGLLFSYISAAFSIFAGFLALGVICFAALPVFRAASKNYFSNR
jgi:hypothetical protein